MDGHTPVGILLTCYIVFGVGAQLVGLKETILVVDRYRPERADGNILRHGERVSRLAVILLRKNADICRTTRRVAAPAPGGRHQVNNGIHLGKEANDLWCADYKGEFMLGSKRYCYPLTVTDYTSRYLIACEALETTKEEFAITVFEDIFKEYRIPKCIRTDNGVPFAHPNALYGLSRLSVWWLRLGIRVERIEPGHPQQNGRHERMHLTLKQEATRPAEHDFLKQQARFDGFKKEFNYERPHQALGMKCPSEVYAVNDRTYRGLPELCYPMHDRTVRITHCGRICIGRRKINLSRCFAEHDVGVKEVDDKLWLVSFMDYDLGYFDEDNGRVEPIDNPFVLKV